MSKKEEEGRPLTPEEFITLALKKLKKPEHAGIHTVYSGFNAAFRKYFPGLDPVKIVAELAEQGKIKFRLARGGAIIFPADSKVAITDEAKVTLERMGLT